MKFKSNDAEHMTFYLLLIHYLVVSLLEKPKHPKTPQIAIVD